VRRGGAGSGASSVVHTASIVRRSAGLPTVIEVADAQERLDQVLPAIDTMRGGGRITLEKVRAIRHTKG
jgi:hypothetical protein